MGRKRRLVVFRGRVGMVDTDGRIYVDEDPPIFHREKRPVARKHHRCCECREPIQPGEQYQLIEGIWDEDCWARFKTCAECADMRDNVWRQVRDAVPFGGLLRACAEDVEDVLSVHGAFDEQP